MKARTEFIRWLRDAHAMENAMGEALRRLRDDEKAPPLLRRWAGRHSLETQQHAEVVAACLKDLGEPPSKLRADFARVVERLKNTFGRRVKDRHVKALQKACASESFEIACYSALRASAARLGLDEFVVACSHIIEEERRTVKWLETQLPGIMNAYLDCREMEKSVSKRVRQLLESVRLKNRDD